MNRSSGKQTSDVVEYIGYLSKTVDAARLHPGLSSHDLTRSCPLIFFANPRGDAWRSIGVLRLDYICSKF